MPEDRETRVGNFEMGTMKRSLSTDVVQVKRKRSSSKSRLSGVRAAGVSRESDVKPVGTSSKGTSSGSMMVAFGSLPSSELKRQLERCRRGRQPECFVPDWILVTLMVPR